MTVCCNPVAPLLADEQAHNGVPLIDDAFLRTDADGTTRADFLLPDIYCAACLSSVERAALSCSGVTEARANLTTKRISVRLAPGGKADDVFRALERAGQTVRPFELSTFEDQNADASAAELWRGVAVSGFAAANVMLLSVSVWSGAEGATRDMFHWLSAMIALPAIAYAGRPFFRSAFRALRHGRTNMDVPISIGVVIASLMSLYETATGGPHAWFDASISLLFFLLIGRALDHRMRDVARSSAVRLLTLSPKTALKIDEDGTERFVPAASLKPGDIVRVAPGDRLPIDGTVKAGESDIDRSWLTGESAPESVGPGALAHAGTINLSGSLDVAVTAAASATLLSEIVRLMEAVERPAGAFVRLADRVARYYAPLVHVGALLTFTGWMLAGAGWHFSLTTAVAVLIITCPCALGLAVPAVQVVAAGYLLNRGILVKDGGALERLAQITHVVLDKTGTLTEGRPRLVQWPALTDQQWSLAAAIARRSRHPLARALAEAAPAHGAREMEADFVTEHGGQGIEGEVAGQRVQLGRARWLGVNDDQAADSAVWLRIGDEAPMPFRFVDALRTDAAETIQRLRRAGMAITLLSGDLPGPVLEVARATGISDFKAQCLPQDKVEMLSAMRRAGHRVLMVGDGLNDAPALAAAHISMSPATGADIAQSAADIVFTGTRLSPIMDAFETAVRARQKIVQNVILALLYNLLAVPVAILGFATPLLAAIAMSTSSILVIGNALTVNLRWRRPTGTPPAKVASVTQ